MELPNDFTLKNKMEHSEDQTKRIDLARLKGNKIEYFSYLLWCGETAADDLQELTEVTPGV